MRKQTHGFLQESWFLGLGGLEEVNCVTKKRFADKE